MAIIYIIFLIIIGLVLLFVVFPIGLLSHFAYTFYKKKKKIRAMMCASIGILYTVFCIISFLPRSARHVASDLVGFPFSHFTHVIEFSGEDFSLPIPGGMSDGEVYVVLQLSEQQHQQFLQHIEKKKNWRQLPLSEDFIEHSTLLEPNIGGGYESQHKIPFSSQDGFYVFVDYQALHNKNKKRKVYDTDTPFYQRDSYNFMFALYDQTTYQLYIYELHT